MSPSKILLLGSGFVAKPTLDILAQSGLQVTVGESLNWSTEGFGANELLKTACRTLKTAQEFCKGVGNATPISLDVSNSSALDAEVAKNDLVIRYSSIFRFFDYGSLLKLFKK